MNTMMVYVLKSACYMAAFYIVYSLLLSKDTLYARNRLFIITSLLLSLVLPLITIHTARPVNMPFFGKTLSEIFVTGSQGMADTVNSHANEGNNWSRLLWITYLTGVALFGLKFIFNLLELAFIIIRHRNDYSNTVTFSGFNTAGFSAMGHVFINSRLSPEESAEIIKHEMNHIEKNHFSDILLIEIVKCLQWFNPVAYMFNRSLRAIHEYQADECCLRAGVAMANYQKLLLNQALRTNIFTIPNSFSNPTLIKKRMIMMTKKRSRSLANLKLLAVLPLLAAVMLAFSTCSESKDPVAGTLEVAPPPPPPPPVQLDEPFTAVEEMPLFPGGDAALLKFINENTTYPESAKERGAQGRVIVKFAVEANGQVGRTAVLKGIDPDLDTEAARVVSTLPDFQPGKQGGKNVAVWYMVPITFTLK